MIKNIKQSLQPAVELKAQAADWSALMEAFASMRNEDSSQLSFGHGIPPERNEIIVEFAIRFQAAMAPIADLKQQVFDALQEQRLTESAAEPNGGKTTLSGSSVATQKPA